MSFVAREMERLSRALREEPEGAHYAELYAAQQALAWALDPSAARSPYAMIMGIVEGSTGHLVDRRPLVLGEGSAVTGVDLP